MLLLFLICLIIFTSGCWDREEPDEIGIVIMAAFDIDEDSGLNKVVAQVANPLAPGIVEDGGDAPYEESTWVVEATGHSTYEAIQNLELLTTRALDWSHVEVLVISEKIAEQGLRPILDFFDRERQSRLITRPLMLKGDINQLMEVQFPLEVLGGDALGKHLLHVQEERSTVSDVDSMRIMFQQLSAPGQDLVLPLGEVILEEEEEEGEGLTPGTIDLSGSAVFRNDRLAGFIDGRESTGYLWITGQIQRATLVVKCPGCEEKLLTIEIFQTETELKPEITGYKPRFELQVRTESRIQEFACPEFPTDKEFMEALNRRLATVIRNEIEMSLDKAKELQTDIFGLGNLIFRKKPQVWEEIEDEWPDIFEEAEVDIEVKAVIRRHGQVTDPVIIR